MDSLRDDAEHVQWGSSTRDERFALVSKSGFVDGLEDDLGDNWSLFGASEPESLLAPANSS